MVPARGEDTDGLVGVLGLDAPAWAINFGEEATFLITVGSISDGAAAFGAVTALEVKRAGIVVVGSTSVVAVVIGSKIRRGSCVSDLRGEDDGALLGDLVDALVVCCCWGSSRPKVAKAAGKLARAVTIRSGSFGDVMADMDASAIAGAVAAAFWVTAAGVVADAVVAGALVTLGAKVGEAGGVMAVGASSTRVPPTGLPALSDQANNGGLHSGVNARPRPLGVPHATSRGVPALFGLMLPGVCAAVVDTKPPPGDTAIGEDGLTCRLARMPTEATSCLFPPLSRR